MNCLLVPTLAMDISLLDRLAESIDYRIEHKVIILNGNFSLLSDKWKNQTEWQILPFGAYHGNIGVSASWNFSSKGFSFSDSFLIVNDDWQFQKGHLELMCKAADEHPEAPTIHFTETEGYNCFVWNRIAIEKIGLFDENFYCAYWEDVEYRLRMRLAGLKPHIIGLKDSDMVHGKPRTGGANYRKLLDAYDIHSREYFLRKWGAITDKPNNITFKYPFNNPKNDVKFWELEKERHRMLVKMWDDFINEGNTIYT